MLQTEFETLIDDTVDIDKYELIETVYMYFPGFDKFDGKQLIADLYKRFGIVIIKSMYSTAMTIKFHEEQIAYHKRELQNVLLGLSSDGPFA